MNRELWVYLDGQRIGSLTQTDRGAVGFSYLESYVETSAPTPLSLSMPTTRVSHPHKPVHSYLEGLLPDSQDVRERWARMYGVSARNPFALLSHVGRDAAGAVQILPPGVDSDDAASQMGDMERLSLNDLDELLTELAEHRTDWNAGRRVGRWSLAGAQSKIALHQDADGAWGIPLDSTPTNRIVKPALAYLPDHHINEALAQRTASRLGLPAAVVDVIETGQARALVAHRYESSNYAPSFRPRLTGLSEPCRSSPAPAPKARRHASLTMRPPSRADLSDAEHAGGREPRDIRAKDR